MSSVKRVLGRGLADLIPVGGDSGSSGSTGGGFKDAAIGLAPGASGSVLDSPIAALHPNPRQPRTKFDDAALEELAASIQANGILQPILVRPRPTGGYEIVAGERRYRASLRAGLKSVPIIIRELTDAETLAVALIENLIREDIGPLETARAFQRLMEDFGWTQEEMGKRVGKSRTAVTNTLRLLELPLPILQSLEKGEISEGHARTLLGDRAQRDSPDFRDRQNRIFQQIKTRGLSVREVERLMRADSDSPASSSSDTLPYSPQVTGASRETPLSSLSSPATGVARSHTPAATSESIERRALEDRLRDALGTQVRISGTEERGRIEIEFFSADELDGLMTRLESTFAPKPERITAPDKASTNSLISGLLSSRRPEA